LRKTTIVIVNFYTSRYVKKCLESLRSEVFEEVIVVDNSVDPAEYDALVGLTTTEPRLRVVQADANHGFGYAVNYGANFAGIQDNDFLWVLNPDILYEAPVLSTLRRSIEFYGYDIVSPAILYAEQPPTYWYNGGDVDPETGRATHRDLRKPALSHVPSHERPPEQVTFMTGAAPLFSGYAWNRLGGFRSDLFMYWEDVDLSLRALSVGIKMGVCLSAQVHHEVGAASGDHRGMSPLFYFYNARNRLVVLSTVVNPESRYKPRFGLDTLRTLLLPLRREKGFRRLSYLRYSIKGTGVGMRIKAGRLSDAPLPVDSTDSLGSRRSQP